MCGCWWRWSQSQQRLHTCWQTLHWCCGWSLASHLCSLCYKIFMCSMMERAATGLDLHCGKLNSRYDWKPAEQEQPRHISLQPSWSTGSWRKHLHHLERRSNPAPSSQSQTHNHPGVFTHLAMQIRVQQHEGAGESVNCVWRSEGATIQKSSHMKIKLLGVQFENGLSLCS